MVYRINNLRRVDSQAYQACQYTWVTEMGEFIPSLNSRWHEVSVDKDWSKKSLLMPLSQTGLLISEYDLKTFDDEKHHNDNRFNLIYYGRQLLLPQNSNTNVSVVVNVNSLTLTKRIWTHVFWK